MSEHTKKKGSFWRRSVDLEVPPSTLDSHLAFEENPFRRAVDRYFEEKDLSGLHKKMVEELEPLRQAVRHVSDVELARAILRDIGGKFAFAYHQIAMRFSSHH